MNKVKRDMNKTNIPIFSERQIQLEEARITQLGEFWNGFLLSGGFWRLYWNDAPGAGVILDGKKNELQPDALYVLPPFPELYTFWSGREINQFYIHFEAASLFGSPDCRLNRIDLTPELRLLLEEAYRLAAENRDSGRLDLTALALVAVSLTRLPPEALCELDRDRRITRICDWIRSHTARELDIPVLAARAGFAPNAFIRRFREVTGCTPHQYLLNLRYIQAARLLESTDLGIDEIIAEIGVRDRFHFSRTFKRFYGTPPATFRVSRRCFGAEAGSGRASETSPLLCMIPGISDTPAADSPRSE